MSKAEPRNKKVKDILKKLEEGVKDLFTSEKYKQYLHTMSKFHHYSFNNTILIAMQRPDATLVAGYTAWKQKFHRQVKKGEKEKKRGNFPKISGSGKEDSPPPAGLFPAGGRGNGTRSQTCSGAGTT